MAPHGTILSEHRVTQSELETVFAPDPEELDEPDDPEEPLELEGPSELDEHAADERTHDATTTKDTKEERKYVMPAYLESAPTSVTMR